MVDLIDKVVVVTGASSGIGAAIVKELLAAGMKVVGLARRKALIEELGNGYEDHLFALAVDLTKEEDISIAFEWVGENVGPIHALINNAAFAQLEPIDEANTAGLRRAVETNLLALMVCTKEAVKVMKASEIDGTIININSIGGHYILNVPHASAYNATKFGVTGFTECIRKEVISSGRKIKVTSLSPGLVDTAMSAQAIGTHPFLTTEDIAAAVKYILTQPANVNITELTIRPVGEMI